MACTCNAVNCAPWGSGHEPYCGRLDISEDELEELEYLAVLADSDPPDDDGQVRV